MKDWTCAHTEVLLTVVEASATSAHPIGDGLRLASFSLPDRVDEEPTVSILNALVERGLISSWGDLTLDRSSSESIYVAIIDPARHVFVFNSPSLSVCVPDEE